MYMMHIDKQYDDACSLLYISSDDKYLQCT